MLLKKLHLSTLLLVAAIIAVVLSNILFDFDILQPLEHKVYDSVARLRQRKADPEDQLKIRIATAREEAKRAAQRISLYSSRIGRTVEHYRWRFYFGAHALRGKKVLSSGSIGGAMTKGKAAEKSKPVLVEMARLLDGGHSVARAAGIAAQKGIGTSTMMYVGDYLL